MEGIMKELGKCRAVIALLCFTATVFSGCGNRTEAVITDGEDITTVSAEYPTLEESHADIFTYKNWKYFLSYDRIPGYSNFRKTKRGNRE